jgi:hypothetical protein
MVQYGVKPMVFGATPVQVVTERRCTKALRRRRRPFPVVISADTLRQRLDQHEASRAGYPRRIRDFRVLRLGGARPRVLGAERLRGREGRAARHVWLQGKNRSAFDAGGRGLLRPYRMGRDARVEQRPCRNGGHLVSCHDAMARRTAQSAPSQGDDPLGRRERPVPQWSFHGGTPDALRRWSSCKNVITSEIEN